MTNPPTVVPVGSQQSPTPPNDEARTDKAEVPHRFFTGIDLLLHLVARLNALAIGVLALFVGSVLVFGSEGSPFHYKMQGVLQSVGENWKATVLLVVPLFYLPVRRFLYKARSLGNMHRTVVNEPNPSQPTQS